MIYNVAAIIYIYLYDNVWKLLGHLHRNAVDYRLFLTEITTWLVWGIYNIYICISFDLQLAICII